MSLTIIMKIWKSYKNVIISTITLIAIVLLVNFVLDIYLPFLKTAPINLSETIIYWMLSPFNEAHESIILNFYFLLPAFITIGVYYNLKLRRLIKFQTAFIFAIVSTWVVYIIELFRGINNGSGTSIIGVSLFSVSVIAAAVFSFDIYNKGKRLIRSFLEISCLHKISYIIFAWLMVYSLLYFVTYFDNNFASIILHLGGLGIFILLSVTYIKITHIFHNKRKIQWI